MKPGEETYKSNIITGSAGLSDRVLILLVLLLIGLISVKEVKSHHAGRISGFHDAVETTNECMEFCTLMDNCLSQSGNPAYMDHRDMVRNGCPGACVQHYSSIQKCLLPENSKPAILNQLVDQCKRSFDCLVISLSGKFSSSLLHR